jgi:hypothetical protein
MSKGVIGESGADRATDKMDKWISKSNTVADRPLTILEQYQKYFPNTWKDEIKSDMEKEKERIARAERVNKSL